ncbi:hypothetical protein A4X09_0g4951 [Tilletia walkeri]|uniref:Uncharacterized protein n=2 Tax=Tilletia TaxID=13289 RepID=A0A8X7N6R6_9BASI|nr:hypothetical protein A4X13_0g4965 [Tilletia indica]KAE8267398.1 hypothetical protein A4X09_0g4951 [Tilletia walkeri]
MNPSTTASSTPVRAISAKQAEEGNKWFALMQQISTEFMGVAKQPGGKTQPQDLMVDLFQNYLANCNKMFTKNSKHAAAEKQWPVMLDSIMEKLFPHPKNKYCYNRRMLQALMDKNDIKKMNQWQDLIEQLMSTQANQVTQALASDADYKVPATQLVAIVY